MSQLNIAAQQVDETSMLNLYRELIQYRRRSQALLDGTFTLLDIGGDDGFAYLREHDGERILVALNFSSQTQNLTDFGSGKLRLST